MLVPHDGQDPLELVRPVGVHPDGLPADEVIQVVPGFFPEGLAWLVSVGDLWGVDAEEPDAELDLVAREDGERVAVGDVLDGGDEGSRGRCESGGSEGEDDGGNQPEEEAASHEHSPAFRRSAG